MRKFGKVGKYSIILQKKTCLQGTWHSSIINSIGLQSKLQYITKRKHLHLRAIRKAANIWEYCRRVPVNDTHRKSIRKNWFIFFLCVFVCFKFVIWHLHINWSTPSIDLKMKWNWPFFSVCCVFVALQTRGSSIWGSPVCKQGLQCLPRYLYRKRGPADGT